MKPLTTRPVAALGVAVLATSSAAILARESGAPPAAAAFYRMALTALALMPFVLGIGRSWWAQLDRKSLALALAAGGFLGAHYITWFSSLQFTSVASSVVLVSIHPLVVALLAGRVTKERVGPKTLMAISLSLVGAVGLAVTDLEISVEHLWGDLLALAGGVLAAFYFLIGRILRQRLFLLPYMFVVYGSAAGFVLLYCLVTRVPLLGYDSRTLVFFFLLALIPTLIGHTLLNWTLRYLRAHIVSLFQLGEPIGATILAFVLLSEVPPVSFYPAGLLILLGIFLVLWMDRGERKTLGAEA